MKSRCNPTYKEPRPVNRVYGNSCATEGIPIFVKRIRLEAKKLKEMHNYYFPSFSLSLPLSPSVLCIDENFYL